MGRGGNSTRQRPAIERFLEKVAVNAASGCWEWQATVKSNGYGSFAVTRRHPGYAHRFAYEHFIGPIPTGLEIDHLCRNRRCVNPSHLEAVDHTTNLRRGINFSASKSECVRGHPFDSENTGYRSNGHRFCRRCASEQTHRYSGQRGGHRTACPQGHPYDTENTWVSARGFFACRTCNRERARQRRAAQRTTTAA